MRESKDWNHFHDETIVVRKQIGQWADGRPIFKKEYQKTGRKVRWIKGRTGRSGRLGLDTVTFMSFPVQRIYTLMMQQE